MIGETLAVGKVISLNLDAEGRWLIVGHPDREWTEPLTIGFGPASMPPFFLDLRTGDGVTWEFSDFKQLGKWHYRARLKAKSNA